MNNFFLKFLTLSMPLNMCVDVKGECKDELSSPPSSQHLPPPPSSTTTTNHVLLLLSGSIIEESHFLNNEFINEFRNYDFFFDKTNFTL